MKRIFDRTNCVPSNSHQMNQVQDIYTIAGAQKQAEIRWAKETLRLEMKIAEVEKSLNMGYSKQTFHEMDFTGLEALFLAHLKSSLASCRRMCKQECNAIAENDWARECPWLDNDRCMNELLRASELPIHLHNYMQENERNVKRKVSAIIGDSDDDYCCDGDESNFVQILCSLRADGDESEIGDDNDNDSEYDPIFRSIRVPLPFSSTREPDYFHYPNNDRSTYGTGDKDSEIVNDLPDEPERKRFRHSATTIKFFGREEMAEEYRVRAWALRRQAAKSLKLGRTVGSLLAKADRLEQKAESQELVKELGEENRALKSFTQKLQHCSEHVAIGWWTYAEAVAETGIQRTIIMGCV